jgi:hypothetical protein
LSPSALSPSALSSGPKGSGPKGSGRMELTAEALPLGGGGQSLPRTWYGGGGGIYSLGSGLEEVRVRG